MLYYWLNAFPFHLPAPLLPDTSLFSAAARQFFLALVCLCGCLSLKFSSALMGQATHSLFSPKRSLTEWSLLSQPTPPLARCGYLFWPPGVLLSGQAHKEHRVCLRHRLCPLCLSDELACNVSPSVTAESTPEKWVHWQGASSVRVRRSCPLTFSRTK